MIIHWLLPEDKMGGGGRKERFSNRCIKLCVVEGLFTVSRQVAGQLMMPGFTGQLGHARTVAPALPPTPYKCCSRCRKRCQVPKINHE